MIKKLILYFFSSKFVKNNIRLIGGTTIAQFLNFIFNIYLTRVYAPESFGEFSLYMSFISYFLICSALKLDIEIVKTENDTSNILLIRSLQSNLFFSFLSAMVFAIFRYFNLFNFGKLNSIWILLAFLIVFLQTSMQLFWMYCVKQQLFAFQGKIKIIEALLLNSFYVVFQKIQSLGLVLANFLTLIVTNIILIVRLKKSISFYDLSKNVLFSFEYLPLITIFRKQFYYMWQSILELLQVSLLTFYLSSDLAFLGYYSLAFRTLQVPFRLISMPLSQVFFSEIADRKRQKKPLRYLVLKTFFSLLVISLPIVLMILLKGPDLFSLVFGKDWAMAGTIAQVLLLWIITDFLKAPLMQILYVFNKQKWVSYALSLNILILILIMIVSNYWSLNYITSMWLISITQAIFISSIIFKAIKTTLQYEN